MPAGPEGTGMAVDAAGGDTLTAGMTAGVRDERSTTAATITAAAAPTTAMAPSHTGRRRATGDRLSRVPDDASSAMTLLDSMRSRIAGHRSSSSVAEAEAAA